MDVTASAPGRVNLIGEHTDHNGGLCLPFAIGLRTTVTLAPRADQAVRARSRQAGSTLDAQLDELSPGSIGGWAAYLAGVLWALREDGWTLPGLDVTVDGAVPLGAGLSSSAALECAVATAVAGLMERPLDRAARRDLAELCVRAETEFVGAPTGGMDQRVAMLAEPGEALLLDFAEHTERAVGLPLAAHGLAVLVVDTGNHHTLADSDGYAARRSECTAAAAALGVEALCAAAPDAVAALSDPLLRARARHAVSEDRRVAEAVTAIGARDWPALGGLLTASHTSLREDFEVSTPVLDLAVAAACDAGALGARLVGGGFGGSAIVLTAQGRVDGVRNAIDAAFTAAGHPRPAYHLVAPSAGAALT